MNKHFSAYSNLKIFHQQEAINNIKNGKHIAPIHVQIIPTNRCNQSCEGCAYRLDGYSSNKSFYQQDELSWEKLQEIVCDCKEMGVKAIQLTGGGEPTLHPKFLDLCSLILGKGISLGVVTNGVKWSNDHSNVLSRCKWVRFSIDSGNKNTYASYRKASVETFNLVRQNVRQLVSQNRPPDSIIGIGFVVNNQNWKEVIDATKQAKEDGVDNFRISALFQNDGANYFNDFYTEAQTLCKEAELLTTENFKVFNLFGDRISDLEIFNPDYSYCGMSKVSTYLGADQKAYSCCVNAYNQKGIIGEFKTQTFKEMWNSAETKLKIANIDARNCSRCMYNTKNKTIIYAIDPNPLHTEFI